MVSSSVARRYARALFALGVEDGQYETYASQLERVAEAFAASEELRDLWLNPAYSREQRLAALAAVEKPLNLGPLVVSTLRLLVERQRVGQLEAIVRAYRELADERSGRIRAQVISARELPGDVVSQVSGALSKATGREISLETLVDPSLLGGLVAQVGSTVLDGSLRTQLVRLGEELRTAPLAG